MQNENMKSSFNRRMSHLDDPLTTEYIKAVENAFDQRWLKKNNNHPLQILWNRQDALATNELYALGKAIYNLTKNHSEWLKTTVKSVKNANAQNAGGYITEILICGSINGINGKVTPAQNSQSGYDLTIRFSDNFHYLISIKNHDKSTHEKSFQAHADKLRDVFIYRMKTLGINGELIINCEDYIEQKDFDLCSNFLQDSNFDADFINHWNSNIFRLYTIKRCSICKNIDI